MFVTVLLNNLRITHILINAHFPFLFSNHYIIMTSSPDLSIHVLPLSTPLSSLEASAAFSGLSQREKLYCHHLSRAAWEGGPICLLQTSPESVPIFLLLKELFSRQTPASLQAAVESTVSEEEFRALMLYTAGVFTNAGNYKGFGDTKIIPGISRVGSSLSLSHL